MGDRRPGPESVAHQRPRPFSAALRIVARRQICDGHQRRARTGPLAHDGRLGGDASSANALSRRAISDDDDVVDRATFAKHADPRQASRIAAEFRLIAKHLDGVDESRTLAGSQQ